VKKHASQRWMVLYIERWLKAPVQEEDGRLVPRGDSPDQIPVQTWLQTLRAQSPFSSCGETF